MFVVAFFAIFTIFQTVFGDSQGDRLRFSDRREPENFESRTFNGRGSYTGSGSNIADVFKIPIAVIKGTSAAAQAFSPENSQAIQSIFDIPVTTLDAVGNYIKESRPQRIGSINNNNDNDFDDNNNDFSNNNNNAQNFGSRRPLSLSDQRRQERRERILRMRQQERDRRKVMDEERFFHLGHHSSLNLFSSLADLLVGGGGGYHNGNLFGGHGHGHGHHGHGHGHQWKPPKRPRPSRPGHHGGHGSAASFLGGNNHYAVHEQVNDRPIQSGIFSWLQTGTSPQFNDNEIQNKIAPGSEYRISEEKAESRAS